MNSNTRSSGPVDSWWPVVLTIIVVVAAMLRLWGLGQQSLWYDEAVTLRLVRSSLSDMLAALPTSERTPPAYYLSAWGWVRVVGASEVGLRSLSVLAGIATVPLAYSAARWLFTRKIALLAAGLVAVNPLLVWYSQEARAYSLLVLTATAAFWLFVRAIDRRTSLSVVAWALVSGLALSVHYFAIFLIVAEAMILMAQRRIDVRAKLVGFAIITAVGGALLRLAVGQEAGGRALPLSLPERLGEIGPQFLMGFSPPASRASLLLGIASIAVAGFLLLSRGVRAERRGASLAAAVGLSGVGLPLVLAFAGLDYLITRNVIGALIPLAFVVAAGLGAGRAGLLGLTAGATLAAASISMVVGVRNDPLAQRPPWAEVAEPLRKSVLPRAIVLAQKGTWATPLGIHMPRTWRLPAGGASVVEIQFLRRLPTPRDCRRPKAWWGPMCAVNAEQSRRLTLPKSFRLVSTQRVAGFEILRFRSPHAVHIHSLRRRVIRTQPASRAPDGRPSNVLLTPTKSPLDQ